MPSTEMHLPIFKTQLFHIIAISKDSVHHKKVFSLYHQELQRPMGIGLSQRLHPLYGIDFHKLSDYVTVVTLLKLYWKHTCSTKSIHVNYHLRFLNLLYSVRWLWNESSPHTIIFLLEPFSFFIGFVIFSSFVYMFSAPRIRQLDSWRFISLYYYFFYMPMERDNLL